MISLKRILWFLLGCQALVVFVIMRKYLLNNAKTSDGSSKTMEIGKKSISTADRMNKPFTAGGQIPEGIKKKMQVDDVAHKRDIRKRSTFDERVFVANSRIIDQKSDEMISIKTPVVEKTKGIARGARIASSEHLSEFNNKETSAAETTSVVDVEGNRELKHALHSISINIDKNHKETTNGDSQEDNTLAQFAQNNKTLSFKDRKSSYSHFSVNHDEKEPSKSVMLNEDAQTKEVQFSRNWCRVQQARTDWKNVLKPCENHTIWGEKYFDISQATSAETSYISWWDIRPAGSFSRFHIQSLTAENERKSIGGDSWRVHLRGPSSIGPTVFDLNNGSYEVLFLVMEPGRYNVEMWLDYTLCTGFKDTPSFFFKSGNPQGKNHPDGILDHDKSFLIHKFRPHDALISFQVKQDETGFKPFPNNANCSCPSLFWDGLGRWVGHTWKPYIQDKIRTRQTNGKGSLIIYGDSVANHFQEGLLNGPYMGMCSTAFSRCRRAYHWIYNMEGYWGEDHIEPLPDGKDFDHNRVLNDVRKVLYEPAMDKNSVLLLNWGIHFAAAVSFKDYRRLITEFIHIVKNGETDPKTGEFKKFKGQLLWKTTTAINRDRWPNPHRDSRRFLTFPRLLLYNAFATSAMCKAGIDVIDVYPMSDAYPEGTLSRSDPVHYEKSVFRTVEKLLYDTFLPPKNLK